MKSRLVILTFIFIFAFSTIARADVIADRPGDISGTGSTSAGSTSTGGSGIGGTGGNAGAGSSGTAVIGNSPIISDAPMLDPTAGSSQMIDISSGAAITEIHDAGSNQAAQNAGNGQTAQNAGSSKAAQATEITAGPVISGQGTTGADKTQNSGISLTLPDQKGAVIKAAPETGAGGSANTGTKGASVSGTLPAEKETEASGENYGSIQMIDGPVTGAGTATGEKAPTEASTEAATSAAEAETTKASAPAGPVAAGPGSQRVSLGFGIVSPAHNMGSQNLAIGSVELADGSWQALGYEASIHAPYYKLIRETVDTLGTAWYVVKYSGTRIGNAHTTDGTRASEVWLLKSDCTAKNYIDIATANPTRGKIVAAALELLGSKYAYGGAGPDSFDCSGLVKYVYDKAGVKVPRTSSELCALPNKVDISQLRPGDICTRNGHCGIYIGNDIFIHASESSVGVVAEYLSSYNSINRFSAYINVVGD